MPERSTAVAGIFDTASRSQLPEFGYDRAWYGGPPSRAVRAVVADSWRRSEMSRVARQGAPPLTVAERAVRRELGREPFAGMVEALTALAEEASDGGQVLALADRHGVVMWVDGDPQVVAAGQSVGLVPGASWSEADSGTNAIGTAAALDDPVEISSEEHFKRCLHGWSSSAAPVHEPRSGELVAVIVVWGPSELAHPHGVSYVVAAAEMLERLLDCDALRRDKRLLIAYLDRVMAGCSQPSAVITATGQVLRSDPRAWLGDALALPTDDQPLALGADNLVLEPIGGDDGYLVRLASGGRRARPKPRVHLRALGRLRLSASVDGRELEFSLRQSEILVILAFHPRGLTEFELMNALYTSARNPVTVRAELSRLRRVLGPIIANTPYRLDAEVRADFLQVERLIEHGRTEAARERSSGALLPDSDAPRIVAARTALEAALRPQRRLTPGE